MFGLHHMILKVVMLKVGLYHRILKVVMLKVGLYHRILKVVMLKVGLYHECFGSDQKIFQGGEASDGASPREF